MKAGIHVQFTGILPVELQKIKKKSKDKDIQFVGTVVKKIGTTKLEVKPRYKRFTVVVKIADVTQIKESAFLIKQKFPDGKSKPAAKKPAVKKSKPKCDTPAKITEAVKEAKAEVKEKEPAVSISEPESNPAEKLMETPQPTPVPKIPVDKPFPLNGACLDDMPKKKEEKPYNWVEGKPVNETPDAKPTYNTDME